MAAPARNDGPVLDPAALDQLRALQRPGRPNLIERVIKLFRVDAPARLEALKLALAQEDWDSFRREAHTLKSSAANIGANHMRQIASAAERAVLDRRIDELKQGVTHLESALEEVLDALDGGCDG